jgi:hypothetical protein
MKRRFWLFWIENDANCQILKAVNEFEVGCNVFSFPRNNYVSSASEGCKETDALKFLIVKQFDESNF